MAKLISVRSASVTVFVFGADSSGGGNGGGGAVASVALSWTVVQTVFTSRYARLYYSHPAGGIDFNQDRNTASCRCLTISGTARSIAVSHQNFAPVLQSGFVRSYALAFLLGAVALLLYLGLRI